MFEEYEKLQIEIKKKQEELENSLKEIFQFLDIKEKYPDFSINILSEYKAIKFNFFSSIFDKYLDEKESFISFKLIINESNLGFVVDKDLPFKYRYNAGNDEDSTQGLEALFLLNKVFSIFSDISKKSTFSFFKNKNLELKNIYSDLEKLNQENKSAKKWLIDNQSKCKFEKILTFLKRPTKEKIEIVSEQILDYCEGEYSYVSLDRTFDKINIRVNKITVKNLKRLSLLNNYSRISKSDLPIILRKQFCINGEIVKNFKDLEKIMSEDFINSYKKNKNSMSVPINDFYKEISSAISIVNF